jgi:hypothetical protein
LNVAGKIGERGFFGRRTVTPRLPPQGELRA